MYQTSDIRKGLKIEMDGNPFVIVEFQFVKPGKGCAFTRTKCKNLISGAVLDRTFKSGEKLVEADVEDPDMQYLYNDGEDFHFMNMETFEQVAVPVKAVGTAANYLVEEMIVKVLMYNSRPVNIEVPKFVEFEVTQCEPGVKGNTAQGGSKIAIVSTGAEIRVPLFIEQGQWLRVDTRTGEYVERVKR
jgi:elongation factor P